eukprot:gene23394-biopygen19338
MVTVWSRSRSQSRSAPPRGSRSEPGFCFSRVADVNMRWSRGEAKGESRDTLWRAGCDARSEQAQKARDACGDLWGLGRMPARLLHRVGDGKCPYAIARAGTSIRLLTHALRTSIHNCGAGLPKCSGGLPAVPQAPLWTNLKRGEEDKS